MKYSDEDIGPMFKVRTLVSRDKNDKYKAGSQKEAEKLVKDQEKGRNVDRTQIFDHK